MNVYVIRHGLARSNLADPASCPYNPIFESIEAFDPSLTPQGEMQANLTGKRLSGISFTAAFASPLHRALSTCAGILRHQKDHLTIEVIPALAECYSTNHPLMSEDLRRHIWSDIQLIQPYDLPEDTHHNRWTRACRVVDYLKQRFPGEENVLVVSHGTFISQYLNAALLGFTEEQAEKYCLASENCSITKMRIVINEKITLNTINETSYLGDIVSRDPFAVIG